MLDEQAMKVYTSGDAASHSNRREHHERPRCMYLEGRTALRQIYRQERPYVVRCRSTDDVGCALEAQSSGSQTHGACQSMCDVHSSSLGGALEINTTWARSAYQPIDPIEGAISHPDRLSPEQGVWQCNNTTWGSSR